MANCMKCIYETCPWRSESHPEISCAVFRRKPLSNADRIRSMTDEELAKQLTWEQYAGIRTFLLGFDKELLEDFDSEAKKAWADSVQEKLDWLRQEAKEVT